MNSHMSCHVVSSREFLTADMTLVMSNTDFSVTYVCPYVGKRIPDVLYENSPLTCNSKPTFFSIHTHIHDYSIKLLIPNLLLMCY